MVKYLLVNIIKFYTNIKEQIDMKKNVVFNYRRALGFFSQEEVDNMQSQIEAVDKVLMSKTGAGNDYLGWIDLPVDYDKEEFSRIK